MSVAAPNVHTPEDALEINRAGWNRVAQRFRGGTALPTYGPLAPTEDQLRLLDPIPGIRALELGCGSGHSLRYLALAGAAEVWGLDLSSTQIAFARETLAPRRIRHLQRRTPGISVSEP